MHDPELKAMAAVYEALHGLDAETRKRVTNWVLAKLEGSTTTPKKATGAKRGPKPGKKRGLKAGAKRAAKKAVKKTATNTAKKTGKRGRPPGVKNKAAKKVVAKVSTGKRGRPSKVAKA